MQELKNILINDITTVNKSILCLDYTLLNSTVLPSNGFIKLPYEIISARVNNASKVKVGSVLPIENLIDFIKKNKYINSVLIDNEYVSKVYVDLFDGFESMRLYTLEHGIYTKLFDHTFIIYYLTASKTIVRIDSKLLNYKNKTLDGIPDYAYPNKDCDDIKCIIANRYNEISIPLHNPEILYAIQTEGLAYVIARSLDCTVIKDDTVLYQHPTSSLSCNLGFTKRTSDHEYIIYTFDNTYNAFMPETTGFQFYKKCLFKKELILILKKIKNEESD